MAAVNIDLSQLERYEIIGELSSGAMGCVYKARHKFMDRVVAIKVIHPHLVDSEDAYRRAIREARISANLSHPNIVQTHDVEQIVVGDGFTVCTVYEFVVGPTLSKYLDDTPTPAFNESLRIGREISEGMAYAHEQGVVHRDLKPDNILLQDGRIIKIADFGLARDLDKHDTVTQEGTIVGTPRYMAPEQIKAVPSADLTPAVDVYAMGVILYRLFTGQYPFTGKTPGEIIQKSLNQTPPKPSLHCPSLPSLCDKMIMRALAKRVEERYVSAAHLLAELNDLSSRQSRPVVVSEGPETLPMGKNKSSSSAKTSLSKPLSKAKSERKIKTLQQPKPKPKPKRSGRRFIPFILCFIVAVFAVFHFYTRQPKPRKQTNRTIVDPVPLAKKLVNQNEPTSEMKCEELGALVRKSEQFKRLSLEGTVSDSALGLYFQILLLERSKRYKQALVFYSVLIAREGPRAFRVQGKHLLVDLLDKAAEWKLWHELANIINRTYSGRELNFQAIDVELIAQRAIDHVLDLRRKSVLGPGKVSTQEHNIANGTLFPTAELVKKSRLEDWPPGKRARHVELYCSLLILDNSAKAIEILDDAVEEFRQEGALLGLNQAIILQYKAMSLTYGVKFTDDVTLLRNRRAEAIEIMTKALVEVGDYDKNLKLRLQCLIAAIYCRSPNVHGSSEDEFVKEALKLLDDIKTDDRDLRRETIALYGATKSFVAACGGDTKRAHAILKTVNPDHLKPNDLWWYYRARVEAILEGNGNRRELQEGAEKIMRIVPAPFYSYANGLHFLVTDKFLLR